MRALAWVTLLLSVACVTPGRAPTTSPAPPAAPRAQPPAPPGPPPEITGVAAVATPPGPGSDLIELTSVLRQMVSDLDAGVLDAAQLRERMSGPMSNATLAELERAYNGALATFLNGDYAGAIKTLTGVVDEVERLPDSSEAFALWSKAMLRLARAHGALGHEADQDRVLTRLVVAAPEVKPDLAQFPPSFLKRVDEVKGKVKAGAQRKLTITSASRARVYVNGRDVGLTPVKATLPVGRYRVAALSGSTRVPTTYADLTLEDQTLVLDVPLAESFRPSLGPGFVFAEQERPRRLIAAAAYLRLDRLLVTSVATQGDVTYFVGTLYDARRGTLLREGRVRLDARRSAPRGGIRALAEFIMNGKPDPIVIPPPAPPGPPAAPPQPVMVKTDAKPSAAQPPDKRASPSAPAPPPPAPSAPKR